MVSPQGVSLEDPPPLISPQTVLKPRQEGNAETMGIPEAPQTWNSHLACQTPQAFLPK